MFWIKNLLDCKSKPCELHTTKVFSSGILKSWYGPVILRNFKNHGKEIKLGSSNIYCKFGLITPGKTNCHKL